MNESDAPQSASAEEEGRIAETPVAFADGDDSVSDHRSGNLRHVRHYLIVLR